MKLHWSPRSPFVRKVMITLHETGRLEEVELVRSVVAAHLPPNPAVLADNPLGKIPALVTGHGVLFDSRVICAYLDRGNVLPGGSQVQCWEALADGATDILLSWRTELSRPTGPWQAISASYLTKTRAIMAHLEAQADALAAAPFGPGHVALVCYLGQLDFRWASCGWRSHFPRLAALAADWAQRPSVAATVPADDSAEAADITAGVLTFKKETL